MDSDDFLPAQAQENLEVIPVARDEPRRFDLVEVPVVLVVVLEPANELVHGRAWNENAPQPVMHEPFGDFDRASIRGRLELGGKHVAGTKFPTRLLRQLFGQRVLNEETVVGPHAVLGPHDVAIPRGQRFRLQRGGLGDSKGGEPRSHGKKSSLDLHDARPLASCAPSRHPAAVRRRRRLLRAARSTSPPRG